VVFGIEVHIDAEWTPTAGEIEFQGFKWNLEQ